MAQQQIIASILEYNLRARTLALIPWVVLAALLTVGSTAQAQTFTVLHTFTGGADGSFPGARLTMDRAGNLYGTAEVGGSDSNCVTDQFTGCGTVFKLSHHGSSWTFSVIYTFLGGSDGQYPTVPVVFGPDGGLYGTTVEGGIGTCFGGGCGTVFKLKPPPTFCGSLSCPWTKTELYQFTGQTDGGLPQGAALTFDAAGNAYGTSGYTGSRNSPYAAVYELLPSQGGWSFNVLYAFNNGNQAATPVGGVVFDRHGNLWGTTYYGGIQDCDNPQLPETCGILYELLPSASGWTENTVFRFHRTVGGFPVGGLIFDQAGNIYGTLSENGPGGSGDIYQFTPGDQLNVLTSFSGATNLGPHDGVVMDAAGNLYGTTESSGAYGFGSVFKLSPSANGWVFTDLYDFTGGSDGGYPYATVTLDAGGNIYGITSFGPHCAYTCGTVWEITP